MYNSTRGVVIMLLNLLVVGGRQTSLITSRYTYSPESVLRVRLRQDDYTTKVLDI